MYFLKVSPFFFLSLFLAGCGSNDASPTDPINYYDTAMGSSVTEKGGLVTTKPKISCQVFINPDIGFTDFHSISIKDNQWKPIPSYSLN
ncbi:hypothetical protein [Aliivibrio logei]|uniref:hypothetical protein n=1 Tax=Aliivibrio logei TaxID=688 RepID=UPI0035C8C0E3